MSPHCLEGVLRSGSADLIQFGFDCVIWDGGLDEPIEVIDLSPERLCTGVWLGWAVWFPALCQVQ